MVDELREQKHFYEQEAYNEIRRALQEDFLAHPTEFMTHFEKRPEDLTGAELREFYPHFLVQQRPLSSKNDSFKKRFLAGNLFGGIIPLEQLEQACA